MAYCGATDIRRALTGSSQAGNDPSVNPTNTAADLDDEALNDSVAEASAIVDSYIDGPYEVGVDNIPDIIKYWTRDIAAYYATLVWRKGKAPAGQDNPVTLRFQAALEMLKGVASGEITIEGPSNVDDQPTLIDSAITSPFVQPLFPANDFDLTGRWAGSGLGWPLVLSGGHAFFSEEEAEED